MRHIICDRCISELIDENQAIIIHAGTMGNTHQTHWDLCPSCWETIREAMNSYEPTIA